MKRNALIPILLCLIVITGCKKYEEGPMISFRSKSARITNNWKQQKSIYNGLSIPLGGFITSYIFSGNGSFSYKAVDTSTGDVYSENGTWDLSGSKESIIITSSDGSATYNYTWKILRLKENEMWVTEKDGNDLYEYHFIPN